MIALVIIAGGLFLSGACAGASAAFFIAARDLRRMTASLGFDDLNPPHPRNNVTDSNGASDPSVHASGDTL